MSYRLRFTFVEAKVTGAEFIYRLLCLYVEVEVFVHGFSPKPSRSLAGYCSTHHPLENEFVFT